MTPERLFEQARGLGMTGRFAPGCVSDTLARLRHYGVPGEALRRAFIDAEDRTHRVSHKQGAA